MSTKCKHKYPLTGEWINKCGKSIQKEQIAYSQQ